MSTNIVKDAVKQSVVASLLFLTGFGLTTHHALASGCGPSGAPHNKPFVGQSDNGNIFVQVGELKMIRNEEGLGQIAGVYRCPVINYGEKAEQLVSTVEKICSPDPNQMVDAEIQHNLSDGALSIGLPAFCSDVHKTYPSVPAPRAIPIDIKPVQ